jgi:hypothetical protein
MLRRLTYSNVIATLALVLAVGTGSSYAVSKIDGGAVKSRTLSGKKLMKNTLTGKEIREDKLGTVPFATGAANALNAAKLGGKDAGAYVQGNMAVSMDRTTLTAPSGERVIDTPVGQFRLRCLAATADVRYYNTTGAPASVWRTGVRAAGTSGLLDSVAPGGDFGMAYATPAWSLLRAEQGDKVARLDVNSDKVDASTCRFAWELAVQS